MKQSIIYTLKVWFTAGLLSIIIILIIGLISGGDADDAKDIGALTAICFLPLIPNGLIFFIACLILYKLKFKNILCRSILSIIATIITLFTMGIVWALALGDETIILIAVVYLIIIITGIWFFKFKILTNPDVSEELAVK